MRELLKAGKDAKARGLDPDQAREEILPRLRRLMVTITSDDRRQTTSSAAIRRLVPAPRLRRAQRSADRRNRRDPAK